MIQLQKRTYFSQLIIICFLASLIFACQANNEQEAISAVIAMPTRETDILAKTTLVFDDDGIRIKPLIAETVPPTATSPETIQEPPTNPTSPPATSTDSPVGLTPTNSQTNPLPSPSVDQQVTPTQAPSETPTAVPDQTEPASDPLTPTETVPAPSETPPVTPNITPTLGESAPSAPDARIIIREAQALIGQKVNVPVRIRPSDPDVQIGTVNMRISYDPTVVELEECRMGPLSGVCNLNNLGFVSIAAVNNDDAEGNIALVTLILRGVSSGNAEVKVDQVETLLDIAGAELEFAIREDEVIVP